jgi:multidrug efflux pump subunit AcrA (membrane-fusion protein)
MTMETLTRDGSTTGESLPSMATPERLVAKRIRSSILRILAVVLVVAAAAWAYYQNTSVARPAMDMNARVSTGDSPFPVVLALAAREAMTGTVVYTGSVAALNEQDVFARVTGRVVDIPVYPGDAVRAGQLVARLDDVELTSRHQEAEAMAANAEATRAQMEADVVGAQHAVDQAVRELAMVEAELAYAAAVRARSERLVSTGVIARQEYENAVAMAASLEAKRDAARARIEQTRAAEKAAHKKLQAGEAMVAQSRAAARTAQVVHEYVTITAPTDGYVAKRLIAPGVLVQPGMAILKIAQIDRVRLQANVGERDVASIRVGSPVVVTGAGGQPPLTPRVTAVFPFVDPGARTAVVEAIVENADRRFLPGQYVTMRFVTGGRADAVTVPRGAVTRLGGKARVWVARDDGRAEPREVTTGLEGAERVEIVTGVAPGERVIARGHESLYAGARIAEVGPTEATSVGAQGPPGSAPATPRAAPHTGH